MTKAELRNIMREKSRSMTISVRSQNSDNIFKTIELNPQFAEANCIAMYVALPDEIPSINAIKKWHNIGKRILLPRVEGDIMQFYEYAPQTLKVGSFGILEPQGNTPIDPSEVDLMIVPGMALCADGRRLGRGRGYYDKYLSNPTLRAHKIGVGFAHQLVDDIPCESHDIRLDEVITLRGSIRESHQLTKIIIKVVDAAGNAANKLGCGVEKLLKGGISWALTRLSLDLDIAIDNLDNINIDTWIQDCNRLTTTRNFIINSGENTALGHASSQWCMIDLSARKAIDLTRSDINYSQFIESRDVKISKTGRITAIDESKGEVTTFTHLVVDEDIDFNQHVNTFRYLDIMLSTEPRSNYAPIHLDIHFVHESLLGELLTIRRQERQQPDSQQSIFEILRPDGTKSIMAQFIYRKE